MGEHPLRWRPGALLVLALVLGAAVAASPLAAASRHHRDHNRGPKTSFTVTPLVSDQAGVAPNTDPNLVNAWGLTAGPTTPWWVADNGKDKSTLYGGDGVPRSLIVDVAGGPTGAAFNPTTAFSLTTGGKALFLFDSEDGVIRGWNGAQGTTAVVVKDLADGAIYKGLSVADTPAGPRLYAADFHNAKIDVLDGSFTEVKTNGFHDPFLPPHYAPFNVQVIGDVVYVAYAKQDADAADEIAGAGLGFVDVYSRRGVLLHRVASRGGLNAPWGLVQAPAGFGRFGHALLVGNFGDGLINAYNIRTGQWLGQLRRPNGHAVQIDGLWGLRFGNGVTGDRKTLLFSAGIDDEAHGLFGLIRAAH
jgi:uncharacterized protein (TIGR03118 family)